MKLQVKTGMKMFRYMMSDVSWRVETGEREGERERERERDV